MQNRPTIITGSRFELSEARYAWETQGSAGLAQFLARLQETQRAEAVLTDAAGHDVLTGRDWSREIHSSGSPARRGDLFRYLSFASIRVAPLLIATLRGDKKYYLLTSFPDQRAGQGWTVEVPRETWWMLGVFSMLCYVLARRLTSPLRRCRRPSKASDAAISPPASMPAAPMNSDNLGGLSIRWRNASRTF